MSRISPPGGRQAVEQSPRIRVRGPLEEGVGGRRLHLLARIHHHDAVADLVRRSQIVRGEEHGHAALLHEIAQEAQDLRLDGHVERRRGLVGDDQVRARQERHRDHQPLALAARELVGQPHDRPLRLGNLHGAQDVQHGLAIASGAARADTARTSAGQRRPRAPAPARRGDFHFIRSMI